MILEGLMGQSIFMNVKQRGACEDAITAALICV